MTIEEKELLLKDLSVRLPYEVKCEHENTNDYSTLKVISKDKVTLRNNNSLWHSCNIESVKPYLFPLSSMTEEQRQEIYRKIGLIIKKDGIIDVTCYSVAFVEIIQVYIDWLNSHHFDYRGLIDRGLAIDATGLNIY